MRYYDIKISDPVTGRLVAEYTSLLTSGKPNLSALAIELDVTVVDFLLPASGYVRVWGVGLATLKNAQQFNGKTITVSAGMSKGLPLANPAQAAQLFFGTIQQCFGNWQGVNQTLDFIIVTAAGSQLSDTKNIVLNWQKGQPLAAALALTLKAAYPDLKVRINISAALTLAQDEQGYFATLGQLAIYLDNASRVLINGPSGVGTYPGVRIVLNGNTFVVFDGTSQSSPKAIAFNDLIGQITLISPNAVNMTVVMRGDLAVNDYISLPPGQVVTSSASFSQYRNGSIFTGVWRISSVRHVGASRQPDAESWVTVVEAVQQAPAAVAVAA